MNLSTIVSIASGVSALNVTMASSRFRNSGLKTRSSAVFALPAAVRPRASSSQPAAPSANPMRLRAHLARAGVRRQDEHRVAEVGLPPGVVGQRGVVHHLQQDVVDVRMRLFDFVEQHDAVGMRADGVDEQSALLEPDVPRRRADQPRHGVLLHVLAHVEADELVAEQDAPAAWRARSCRRRSAR